MQHPPGQDAPVLSQRFKWTLTGVGVAYTALVHVAEGVSRDPRLGDLWWWTVLPVAWLVSGLIWWIIASRRRGAVSAWLARLGSTARLNPGHSIFYAGWTMVVMAFCWGVTPSKGIESPSAALRGCEQAGMAVLITAVVVGVGADRLRARARSRQ